MFKLMNGMKGEHSKLSFKKFKEGRRKKNDFVTEYLDRLE